MTTVFLNATQQTILMTGIGAVVVLYFLLVVIRWYQQRRSTSSIVPFIRPTAEIDLSKAIAARCSAKSASSGNQEQTPAAVHPTISQVEEDFPYADPSDYHFGPVTPVLAALVPGSTEGRRSLTKSLRNAGYYSPHAWHNFSAVRYLGIVLPLLLFGTLLVIVPEQLESLMIVGVVVGPILGWALPAIYVRSRAAQRLHEMEVAMPDMLDLLNMCVSQGMTVQAALTRVSREIANVYPALAKELQIVNEQARVGTFSQALTNFNYRVNVPEVHSFSSLLAQTERMGTSVSEALIDYSDGMRETLRQRADEKANSATFKLLFPTVLCLMPAVFLFLMGPALIELNRFFSQGGLDALNGRATIEQYQNRQ